MGTTAPGYERKALMARIGVAHDFRQIAAIHRLLAHRADDEMLKFVRWRGARILRVKRANFLEDHS